MPRGKYSTALKIKLARIYLRGGVGYLALARKHGVPHIGLRYWIDLYRIHGADGFVRSTKHFTAEFKLSVLQRMWAEKLSFTDVAALFRICSPRPVTLWERWYREGGIEALRPRTTRGARVVSKGKDKPLPERLDAERSRDELIAELQQLRMENAYLRKLDALVRARQAPKERK